MNLRCNIAKRTGACPEAGFTMVEIAIALGVIAFALVAIIGVLPLGLQAQKDNREDTIVNQDARMLIEAIKSGGRDLSSEFGNLSTDLGSHVVAVDGTAVNGIPTTNLIKLLTDPVGKSATEPYHEIVFDSISGAIANRGSDLGFRYQVLVHVTNSLDFADTVLSNQVYEVRMRFAWPVLPAPDFKVPREAYTYKARTLVSGTYKDGFIYAQNYWNNIYTNEP